MAIEITNNGASLKIKNGTQVRNIMKSQIQEIVVVKTDTVKIDIGKGALYNVFIPFADVTIPAVANVDALRDAINEMLSSAQAGIATEAKQIEEISKLDSLNTTVSQIHTSVNSLDSKVFFEPVLIDESNPNIIYKGFASPAAKVDDPVWAIQKVSNTGDVCSYQWADGNKNFDNVWNDRATLSYS
jgi:molybdopterin-binding protein